jgi:hypothetical protein
MEKDYERLKRLEVYLGEKKEKQKQFQNALNAQQKKTEEDMDALRKEKDEWKYLSKAKEDEISKVCLCCATGYIYVPYFLYMTFYETIPIFTDNLGSHGEIWSVEADSARNRYAFYYHLLDRSIFIFRFESCRIEAT